MADKPSWSRRTRSQMKSEPASIKIFLTDGQAEGLRTAEISNWTGKAVAAPRLELRALLKREEAARPGVYILLGEDPESGGAAAYIGEAESVRTRLKAHQDKEYWTQAIIFVSKDENLTKAHVKYLEGELIARAQRVGKAQLVNSQGSGAHLPEAEEAEMRVFLRRILQLLPVLGTDFFVVPGESTPGSKSKLLACTIKAIKASGRRTAKGFLVTEGSRAVKEHRPSAKTIRHLRESLVRSGVLRLDGTSLVFTRDHEFGSPSTAASVVRGGSTNGLKAWKNSEGRTLKDIEETIG